jgi:hypothetical protein
MQLPLKIDRDYLKRLLASALSVQEAVTIDELATKRSAIDLILLRQTVDYVYERVP